MEKSLNNYLKEYKGLLERGTLQKAYRGLMMYISNLRIHFINKYPNGFAAGNVYQGYMDISYFSFTPESLKQKKLKIVIVFDHEKMQFDVCLAGQNKQIQEKYWKLLKNKPWSRYELSSTPQDFIVGTTLADKPDFDNLNGLTKQIENGVMKFIRDITDVF